MAVHELGMHGGQKNCAGGMTCITDDVDILHSTAPQLIPNEQRVAVCNTADKLIR